MMELRRYEEGGDSDSGEYMKEELGSYSPYAVESGYMPAMGYELAEMKAGPMNVYAGSGGVSASNRQILDEIAQMLLGDQSASLSHEQAILLAARVRSMQAAIVRDFPSGPVGQAGFEGFVPMAEGGGGYYGTLGGRNIGADNNFDTNCRLSKCSNMLESSFNCLQKNSSTGDLLMNLPRVASLPQLFESVSQGPLSRYMGIQ